MIATFHEPPSSRDFDIYQWVYAEGYPIYSLAWGGYSTASPAVAISQRGSNSSSPFFRMPVEL